MASSAGSFVGAVWRMPRAVQAACLCAMLPTAVLACDCPREYASAIWLTDEGLPHNVVNRIRQDDAGFLWLGTAAGLTRFDGFEFETFPMPPKFSKGGYNLRDLAIATGTTPLAVPPQGGVVQYRGGEFSLHPISEQITGKVAEIYAEPSGAIWAGTYDGVLFRWDKGRIESFGPAEGLGRRGLGYFFATDGAGRTWVAAAHFLGWYAAGRMVPYREVAGTMLQVAPARDGGLWIVADGRLLKLDHDRIEPVRAELPWLALKTSVRCLLEDHRGILWLGTARHGVFRYHCGQTEAEPELAHQGIQSIAEDQEGSIWVATGGGGIGRLRPRSFRIYDHNAGMPESVSTSVCQDELGDLWFANRAGGLVRLRGAELRAFPYRHGGDPIFVSSVCPDRAGNLWIGAITGVYRAPLSDPTRLERAATTLRNPRVLYCSRNGDMWAGTAGDLLGFFRDGEFTEIKREHGFLGEGITAMAEDAKGDVWCGTATGELYRWDGHVMERFDASRGLPLSPIHALYFDAADALWIGSLDGLLLKDEAGFHRFTSAQGLPPGMILQVQEDDHGRLWLGTPSGLFQVAKADLLAVARGRAPRVHVIAHGKDEGLSSLSPTTDYQPSGWKDRQGRLWMTTHQGVLALDPGAVMPNTKAPPVVVKRALLDDEPLDTRTPADIAPGRHQLQFQFAALSFAAPDKVRMRHRLEGVDPHWIETTESRSARYSNLPPGSYRLRVIACNNDGVWNERGATLEFTIRPAWWQTNWFEIGSFLAFTGIIIWGARSWTQRRFRRRVELLEREHALDKERARIARDLHDELGASITGIGMLANRLRASPHPEVQPVVEQLTGRTQRLASDLERVVWTVSPKNNSLERLAVFVGRFAQNFFRDTGVVCLVRGQHTVPVLPLAPDVQHHVLAIAKEAINNVLKHAAASEVVIECGFANGWFSLSIRDNGMGFHPSTMENSERNGLRNMQARIAEVHGRLRVASTPGSGCTVLLQVPITPHVSRN